jgi:hypothetical protein
MSRALERFCIAALAAATAFAVAASMGRSGSTSLPIAHIHHGGYAFFDGTNVECVNPKAGGGVACQVDYAIPRLLPPTPAKYDVNMSFTGLSITKFARSGKILWGKDLR